MSHPGFDDRQVVQWIADEVSPSDAAELEALLTAARAGDRTAANDLADRFAAPLRFGTAGLRGPLRAGPNGMNDAVVRRAAAGVARWLIDEDDQPGAGRIVVVGFDARHGSARFARDSAAVFAAAGFDARLLPEALPTPVLAYAVRALGAAAGIMVTASHNPPADNGYKVYGAGGAQIVSPADQRIEAAIAAIDSVRAVAVSDDYTVLDDGLVAGYVDAVAALVGRPSGPLTIVHTALHGVGTATVRRVFAAAGFAEPRSVPEQAAPDPDFPTVAFPNPEEAGALDLALTLARDIGADLVLANDPDADRCALALPFTDPTRPGAGWRMLTGDETGVLLADALLTRGARGTYANTVVSSSMLAAMAAAHGVGYAETLTGFKWIMRAAPDLVFGYEEALGYAVAPELVRDKDGISAALLLASRADELRAAGSSLAQRLDELAAEYGVHATAPVSIRVRELSEITDTMDRLRARPPARFLAHTLDGADLLPDADVLIYRWDGGRVVIRPSGTEPKLKAYLQVVVAVAGGVADGVLEARAEAARRLVELTDEVRALLPG